VKHQTGVAVNLGKFSHQLTSCVGEVDSGDFHNFNLPSGSKKGPARKK
jgi:hypothetical protein